MKKSLLYFFLLFTIGANAQNYSVGLVGASSQYGNAGTAVSLSGTGGFTVEAWVKTTTGGDMVIVQQRDGSGFDGQYKLRLSNGQVHWFIFGLSGGSDITSTSTVNDGNWHHIAATREADNSARIYIDGDLNISAAGTSTSINNTIGVFIGYDGRDNNNAFTGDLDEVRIWNTVRTQAEIKAFAFKGVANNAAGLVAYYKCDENGGAILVNSATATAGNNAAIVNGPLTWTTSQVVAGFNAVNFDGVDDEIATPINLVGAAAFTIEGWVKPTAAAAGIGFFGQNDAIEFGFSSATSIGGYTAGASGSNTIDWTFDNSTFPLNTWHHVAFTGDGTNMKIYVDGTLRQTVANTSANYGGVASTFPFTIGGSVWAPTSGYLNGSVDEVRVWNVARTQTEIQSGMFLELNPTTQTGLISYYTFNQGVANGTNTFLPYIFDQKGDAAGLFFASPLTGGTSNYVAQNAGLGSLPLNWISFTATKQAQRVVLNWSTAAEEETKDFVVEQSADGVNWHQIGTELAKNRPSVNNYQFVHNFPDKTLNFYRILQRDQNGRSVYSKTLSVRFAGLSRPVIYSNPVSNGVLSLRMENAGTVQMYNAQGLLVMNKQLNAGMQSINVSTLAAGVYLLKTSESTERVIIQ